MKSQEVRWMQLLRYTIALSILKNIRNPEMVEQIARVGVAFYKK